MAREYFIGCISGTSLDGLDVALVQFDQHKAHVISSICQTIPLQLKTKLTALCSVGDNEIDRLGETDSQFGHFIGSTINAFLSNQNILPDQVEAIGSHGQTVRHRPNSTHPFTLQIGNAAVIAHTTGIPTISDFRSADIAAGGQGAPLVPAFHKFAFTSEDTRRLVLNLGGISNISVLPPSLGNDQNIHGYDIGPANTLMDRWIEKHKSVSYDKDGTWAGSGQLIIPLLEAMLKDNFFRVSGPKSTGREHFNLSWLNSFLIGNEKPEDVQRTLLELTAQSVSIAIKAEARSSLNELVLCGGGARNCFLVERISDLCSPITTVKTDKLGIPSDDVEAAAFAWLAREHVNRRPGNLCTVTGAKKPKILGATFLP